MFDEGILVDLFFRLCKRIMAGSYLIVVTYCLNLYTKDCINLGHDHIEFLSKSDIPDSTGGGIRILSVWILKVL